MKRDRYPRKEHTKSFWDEHDKENYICPECERGIESVSGFQVHHINENPEDGREENLIALCRDCHWEIHDISPESPESHWADDFFDEYNSPNSPLKYL